MLRTKSKSLFKAIREPMSNILDRNPIISCVLLATDFTEPSQAAFQASLDLCVVLRASLYIVNVFNYANSAPPELHVPS